MDDVINALAKGLELIWRNENHTKHNVPGWKIEFFLDVVSSTLNTHWSQEYLYKMTDEYKELCLIKAVTQYLKIDQVAIKKIEALYSHLINQEMKLTEQTHKKNEKVIDLNHFRKDKHEVFKTKVIEYIESIFFEKHFITFGNILKKKYIFVLTDFFDTDEIEKLIVGINLSSAN
ncbi:hypothetical protein [Legionella cardiaca]|uniref:Uncharacterized protein n=1 Tax=Legionella cardiaca TaxID=1071983 RepID=A0ABY8ARI0_9GAMM|nr:hypothetical protein [Legionella cardiaca]WED42369.1 hypothetical protein PXX05_10615 [Legionella cardiaca]